MSNLILRAGRDSDNAGHMFQVSSSTPVGLVGRMIARTMNWDIDALGRPIRYRIEAEQLGRLLDDNETLAQAGLFDTCLLIFHSDSLNQPQPDRAAAHPKEACSMSSPVGNPASQDQLRSTISDTVLKSPVSGWKSLDIDIPAAAAEIDISSTENSDQSGFVWKKLN